MTVHLTTLEIGEAVGGGLLIGAAASMMLLGLGRIAGVSGLAARFVGLTASGPPRDQASLFIVGLPLGALLAAVAIGVPAARFPASPLLLAVAGLLVGFGTRLGSGCTSGHGVCGVPRLAGRSVVATFLFMASGMMTVAVMNAVGLAW